jgi:hypothetical protein
MWPCRYVEMGPGSGRGGRSRVVSIFPSSFVFLRACFHALWLYPLDSSLSKTFPIGFHPLCIFSLIPSGFALSRPALCPRQLYELSFFLLSFPLSRFISSYLFVCVFSTYWIYPRLLQP